MDIVSKILRRFGYKKSIGPLPDDATIMRSLRSYLASVDNMEVEDPYKNSVWVFASINAIAQNISRVPFYIYTEKKRDIKKIVTQGPIYDLFTNPNPYNITSTILFSTVLFLELYGEAFWVIERPNVITLPKEIWVVNPTRFEPIIDKNRKFTGWWNYEVGDIKMEFPPHQILQFKYIDPYNDIRGSSGYEPSKIGVEQDYFANKYNKQFFKDGISLSGIVQAPDFLTDEQFNRLKNQFTENHAGYGNAHKVGIIEGGASFLETKAMSQRDMEFNVLKKTIRGEILAAFKTNEVVLGNYENIQCLTPDTEIFTIDGFKKVTEVKVGELIASFNEGKAEFKPVTETFVYDYKGDAYTQQKATKNGRTYASRIDYLITPEHKMFGRERRTKDTGGKYKSDFIFKRISEIEPKTFVSPRNAEWSGEFLSEYSIPNKEDKTIFPIETWMKFLGWFISEGFYRGDNEVGISQIKEEGREQIKEDLKDFPLNLREQKKCFIFSGRHISEFLQKNIGYYCHEKRIPRDILNLHPSLLKHLFDSLMAGDGTKINGTRYTYTTTSKQLANDVYELSIKLGYAPTLYGGEEGILQTKNRYPNAKPKWIISIPSLSDSSRMAAVKPEKVYYEGKVYCVAVPPYHTMMTRYNGKVVIMSNSYEGISNAHQSFWKETLLPKMTYIEDFLWAKFFSKLDGGKYWGGFDFSAIEALREDFTKKVEAAKVLFDLGFTGNEINRRLDLGFEEKPWRDTWWVKTGMIPVDMVGEENEPPEDDEPTDEELGSKPTEPDEDEEPMTEPAPSKDMDLTNRDDSLWQRYISRQVSIENIFRTQLKKELFNQRKRVLTNLFKGIEIFNEQEEIEKLRMVFTNPYSLALKTGIELLKEELILDSEKDESIEEFIKKRLEFSTSSIIRTINNSLNKVLEKNKDKDVNYKADLVRKVYNQTNNRISTIARTESAAVINFVRYSLMKNNGVKFHKWVSKTENGRHGYLDGKVVRLGESFSDTITLRYPLDEKADTSNVINCLCLTTCVFKNI